jgi:GNAT superfamily N-acetyltransferase
MAANLTDADFARLAALHAALLPDSLVARLGEAYAARFWRYAAGSASESILLERESGRIAAAGLLSFQPGTLSRRLLLATPLVLHFARHLPRVFRAALGAGGPDSDLPELLILLTDPALQGRGLGRAVLARAEDELRRKGLDAYTVRSFADESHPAVRFYKAGGFVPLRSFRAHGTDFLLLRKSVGPAPAAGSR